MSNSNSSGMLLVISGPAGVGKGTICQNLLEIRPDLELSVSTTTRYPRYGEVDGINYYFTQKDRFLEKIKESYFLEWAEVHGEYYGTPAELVIKKIGIGHKVILEIDVQGALQVKKNFPSAVLIFIAPPSVEELKKRIIGRGTETTGQIQKRMKTALKEMELFKEYKYLIINEEIQDSVSKVMAIITAEACSVEHYNSPLW